MSRYPFHHYLTTLGLVVECGFLSPFAAFGTLVTDNLVFGADLDLLEFIVPAKACTSCGLSVIYHAHTSYICTTFVAYFVAYRFIHRHVFIHRHPTMDVYRLLGCGLGLRLGGQGVAATVAGTVVVLGAGVRAAGATVATVAGVALPSFQHTAHSGWARKNRSLAFCHLLPYPRSAVVFRSEA